MAHALSASDQIACMQQNGVQFNLIKPEAAEAFLTTSNFFFKLKAFDKCFDKYEDPKHRLYGKYRDLDFAYLIDLSRKDAVLREAILNLALDLEHYLKVSVNRVLMNSHIDTQKLLSEFIAFSEARAMEQITNDLDSILVERSRNQLTHYIDDFDDEATSTKNAKIACAILDIGYALCTNTDYQHILRSFAHLGNSSYSRALVKKYGSFDTMEPWHFMEMASFGDFISFYKFLFYDFSESKKASNQIQVKSDFASAKKIKGLLFPAKTLRNAAAHNDCLLNTLSSELRKPISTISKGINRITNVDKAVYSKTWKRPVVHDFAALLICYETIVPRGETMHRASEDLSRISCKLSENIEYFRSQENVSDALNLIKSLSDCFSKKWSKA